ncbi:hypothetical protein LSH36_992g01028, partial [Paralvinella palmiformis]
VSNRIIVVALQEFNSNEHPKDTGLLQGPTLFNALVAIILKLAVTGGTKLPAYADDLVFISNGLNPFQRVHIALHRLSIDEGSLKPCSYN